MAKTDVPLRKYWNEWEERVAGKLESILQSETKRKRLPFRNISQAADYSAQELTAHFPDKERPFAPTTLTRNAIYRAVLENHVDHKNPKAVTSSERLKFKLQQKKNEGELESLKKQLSNALESQSRLEHKLASNVTHDATQKAVEASFKSWKRIVDQVIKYLEGEGIEWDTQKRTLEDKLDRRALLEESDFPEGFFDWLKRNSK